VRRTLAEKVEPQTTTRRLTCGRITLRTSPLTVVGEMGTVRPPSPEAAVAASRKDALSRESAVVRPLTTSGRAGVAVDKPAEEPSTSPDGVPALSVAFDPVSAGAGSLGGGAESVVPSTASELLPRFEGRLLAAAADAGEKPGAAGNALVAPVSTAPLPPPASGAVPSASGVAVGSVPVAAGSAGVGVHPAACGAAPEPVAGVGSEGVGVHAVAGGAVPGAVVVVVASVALEVVSGGAGAGTSVPGSVAVVSVPSVTAGSVSAAPVAAGEVSASGAVAELLGVPEGSGGARSSARAVLTQIDAQASATSSAAVPPRTRSHRWSASKATRFGTKSAPLAMATVVLRARDYLQSTRPVQGGMRS
jgi:hypothetical protein